MGEVSRSDHLKFCKMRALTILDSGDADEAFNSMCSDIRNNNETRGHIGLELGISMKMLSRGMTADDTRDWINGFN